MADSKKRNSLSRRRSLTDRNRLRRDYSVDDAADLATSRQIDSATEVDAADSTSDFSTSSLRRRRSIGTLSEARADSERQRPEVQQRQRSDSFDRTKRPLDRAERESLWKLRQDARPLRDASPIRRDGVFKLFAPDASTDVDFLRGTDELFYKYFQKDASANQHEVIAVMDTGIVADDNYLGSKVVARYDTAPVKNAELDKLHYHPISQHLPQDSARVQKGRGYDEYRKGRLETDYDPDVVDDGHGTMVAGMAAYGASEIKLADVRVQSGPNAGVKLWNSENVANAIEQTIQDTGARVFTCSVSIDWSDPNIQRVLDKYPDVLFLTTAGNSKTEFNTRKADGETGGIRPNVMLVGGVQMDGRPHDQRGFGSAVDVMVPSGDFGNPSSMSLYTNTRAEAIDNRRRARQALRKLKPQLEDYYNEDMDDYVEYMRLKIYQESINKSTNLQEWQAARDNLRAYKQERGLTVKKRDFKGRQLRAYIREVDNLEGVDYLVGPSDGKKTQNEGVSFGIPVVANVAAKMLLINPDLTASEIRDIMTNSAVSVSNDTTRDLSRSGGVLDPAKAFHEARRLKRYVRASSQDL